MASNRTTEIKREWRTRCINSSMSGLDKEGGGGRKGEERERERERERKRERERERETEIEGE